MTAKKAPEKPKYWGFRALDLHRRIARRHSRKLSTKETKVSESAIVRFALEEYDVNHQND